MRQEFSAVILQHKDINGAYVRIPFDVKELFGAKRVKVAATFDGYPYRGSIVSMGGMYIIGLTQQIRNAIHKDFGDLVLVTVEKDEEERDADISPDFEAELNRNGDAFDFWNTLSYSKKREYADWIASAKKEDTKEKRIAKAISMLKNKCKLK